MPGGDGPERKGCARARPACCSMRGPVQGLQLGALFRLPMHLGNTTSHVPCCSLQVGTAGHKLSHIGRSQYDWVSSTEERFGYLRVDVEPRGGMTLQFVGSEGGCFCFLGERSGRSGRGIVSLLRGGGVLITALEQVVCAVLATAMPQA